MLIYFIGFIICAMYIACMFIFLELEYSFQSSRAPKIFYSEFSENGTLVTGIVAGLSVSPLNLLIVITFPLWVLYKCNKFDVKIQDVFKDIMSVIRSGK